LPSIVISAARRPNETPRATTNNTLGPGTIRITTEAATKPATCEDEGTAGR
jgi:hypothetical protein